MSTVLGCSVIFTTVVSANWSTGFLCEEEIKSSVRISSTRRNCPLANSIKDPFVKFVGALLLFVDLFFVFKNKIVSKSNGTI